jgi:nucleotide-binding universal stress UspA family protein
VPKEVLLLTAGRLGADLLVAGTHGRAGVSRTVLGSVAEDMLC